MSIQVVYPCSGLHTDPLMWLIRRFDRFLYIDYSRTEAEVDDVMARHGVRGYELAEIASVDPVEVIGMSWDQYAKYAEEEYGRIEMRPTPSFLKKIHI